LAKGKSVEPHKRRSASFLAALGVATLCSMALTIEGQTPHPSVPLTAPRLTSDQIVERMVERNLKRSEALRGYSNERHYTITYDGIPKKVTAAMVVEATYEAPSTKRFQILSSTGPKLLINRVLKRLLESEEDAAKDPDRTALTSANYTFTLLGTGDVAGRHCYVFHVDPKHDNKFLYRGKVYVDTEDFAVTQIEVEPAKNPSFWIKKTQIDHVYEKTGEFWLPERNRSESKLRIGGTAVLTIDYGEYHVQRAATP
jgi:adenylate kinase family enzyme